MAGKIFIDSERCKGCGLCLAVCPKQIIVISKKSNRQGYFPAETDNCECTGCGACALICPDAVIEVYRDQATPIVENVGPGNTGKPTMMQEKA
ncbi:MAG TPA: 4Fe-4S dicluster domain-containing protein [Phycisphaerales bacterium]|nr:4Fe-4S dicluster domain-containing protein [Phycisphaerales bacterium]